MSIFDIGTGIFAFIGLCAIAGVAYAWKELRNLI